MRLLIMRHGQSEWNADYLNSPEGGDCDVALTDLGWRQAIAAGKFLENYYEADQTTKWPYVFLSGYQRTKETFSGLVHGMRMLGFAGEPTIHQDPRLIERFGGVTAAIRAGKSPLEKGIAAQFAKMAEGTYQKDSFTTRNMLGESNKDIYLAVQSFMDGTLSNVEAKGKDDFLVVCHGVVYCEFIRAMGELPFTATLSTPGNCDILEATKEDGDEGWKVRQIYDGAAMQPVNIPLLDNHRPYSLADLPPVPDHLQ